MPQNINFIATLPVLIFCVCCRRNQFLDYDFFLRFCPLLRIKSKWKFTSRKNTSTARRQYRRFAFVSFRLSCLISKVIADRFHPVEAQIPRPKYIHIHIEYHEIIIGWSVSVPPISGISFRPSSVGVKFEFHIFVSTTHT